MLSDPGKRADYDAGGLEAVKFREAMDNMDPQVFMEAFLHSGPVPRLVIAGIVCFCWIGVLIFPILLVIKVDSATAWSWPAVFAPLFVFSSFSVLCGCFYAIKGEPPRGEEAPDGRGTLVQRAILVGRQILILVFLALLSVHLGRSDGIRFGAVCIPAFLYEAAGLLETALALQRPAYHALQAHFENASSGAAFPFKSYWEYVAHHVVIHGLRISQWIVLCVAMTYREGQGQKVSWWTALMPAWLLMIYGVLRLALRLARLPKSEEDERVEKPLSATDEDEEPVVKETRASVLGAACCMPPVLPMAVALVLLAARLQGASISLAEVMIPIWVVSGVGVCAICVPLFCLRAPSSGDEDAEHEEAGDEETGSAGHAAGIQEDLGTGDGQGDGQGMGNHASGPGTQPPMPRAASQEAAPSAETARLQTPLVVAGEGPAAIVLPPAWPAEQGAQEAARGEEMPDIRAEDQTRQASTGEDKEAKPASTKGAAACPAWREMDGEESKGAGQGEEESHGAGQAGQA